VNFPISDGLFLYLKCLLFPPWIKIASNILLQGYIDGKPAKLVLRMAAATKRWKGVDWLFIFNAYAFAAD
jgi:hypothetical protein